MLFAVMYVRPPLGDGAVVMRIPSRGERPATLMTTIASLPCRGCRGVVRGRDGREPVTGVVVLRALDAADRFRTLQSSVEFVSEVSVPPLGTP